MIKNLHLNSPYIKKTRNPSEESALAGVFYRKSWVVNFVPSPVIHQIVEIPGGMFEIGDQFEETGYLDQDEKETIKKCNDQTFFLGQTEIIQFFAMEEGDGFQP